MHTNEETKKYRGHIVFAPREFPFGLPTQYKFSQRHASLQAKDYGVIIINQSLPQATFYSTTTVTVYHHQSLPLLTIKKSHYALLFQTVLG